MKKLKLWWKRYLWKMKEPMLPHFVPPTERNLDRLSLDRAKWLAEEPKE